MRDTRRFWGVRSALPLLLSMLLIGSALPAFCQTLTTGDAAGVIKDATGAVVPNSTITLKSADTGDVRTAVSNSAGEYRFDLLKPGQYEISATSTGLKSNVQKFSVAVGQVAEMNLTLNVTATQSVVTVEAQAATLQTENADNESGFTTKQIENLPMPGGDLTTVAMTVPGIRVNVAGGSANMNANGIPGTSIQFTLNGMDENDPANNYNNSGASNNLLGSNEVGEASVVLNAYSPQYGHMAAAQVNLLGKSGTNQFHGNLFYNYNFEKLNANWFFNNATGTPLPRSDAHNFGGAFGGPILKNKLFGFFDIEDLRYVLPGSGVASLPSPQLQAYTLAHVPAASLPLYNDLFSLLKTAPGLNRAIPVTNGTGLLQDSNGHLGCGTGTFAGTPTGTGGVFGVDTPCAVAFGTDDNELNTEQYYTIRTDYNVNDKQKMFFRFNHDNGIQATGISPVNPAFNAVSYQPQYQGGISHTYIFTPALVNNFTGSVLWYQARFGVANFNTTTGLMPEAIQLNDGGANGGGFPTFGASVYPYGFAVGRNVGHIQLNDDLSWTKGTHTFRAGIAYRRDRYNYSSIAQNAFVGQYALSDMADFASGKLNFSGTGLGSSFSQSYPLYGALHFHIPSAEVYVSDDWAVTKNLKLTYGVRFEDNLNPVCVEKCFVLMNTPFDSPTYQGGLNVPYNSTVATRSDLFYRTDGAIVEPRLGIAWKPFGNDKTVIRSGFGLFTTNYTDGTAGTFANQIPNKFAPSGLTSGNIGLANDPTTAGYTAQQSANAFFNGFSNGYTLAQLKAAIAPATFSTPSFASEPAVYHTPHDVEWNLEIQHAFTTNNIVSVNYVGNHGYDLLESLNANMYTGASGISRYGGGYAGLPTAAPDPRFVTVTQYFNNGVSRYDALTIQYRHTYTWGLTMQFHYTWSHALGTVGWYNPLDFNSGYGSLPFDNRHQFSGDLAWTQNHKVDNKVLNALAKGWIVGAKFYAYSGTPFSVTDSKIPSQVNSAGGVITPLADLTVAGDVNNNCGRPAVNAPCLNKADFATYATTSGVQAPVQTDWGNIAPDSFRGPGYFDIDTTFGRNFPIKEKMSFNFGIQAYNFLNHANFANPSGSISAGSFGEITSTVGPPTSIYGSGQGASVSGRVIVLTGRFTF